MLPLNAILFTYLLVLCFVFGTIVGSLLNVCIYRLPLEKSIFWPESRCGRCLEPVRWYDNIPLLSFLILRGKCRHCKASFSVRYFLIELVTGLAFAGLFYLVIFENVHRLDVLKPERERVQDFFLPTFQAWLIWVHHCLLFCFLLVASFCDLDHREIPLSITIPGTILGLALAIAMPWPWPADASQVPQGPLAVPWWTLDPNLGPPAGVYPWPFWGPLPGWFTPGGNWQTGLVTGLVGALVGTVLLRAIRFLFGLGLGIEALGLGDADLLMMAGSFLGWQPIVVAFFVGVFAGLIFGVIQMAVSGDNLMPFGPSLAVGVVATCLGWHWLGPVVQPILFNGWLLIILGGASSVLMLIASYVLRLLRM